MNALRQLFLLDPNVVFLNHGSFGACPIPVFETYQYWQRELEKRPVEFLGRRRVTLMDEARNALAAYVNCDIDDLIFLTNATMGINMIARSLHLQPGDEILATNHEYGAFDSTWNFVCEKTGMRYVRQPMPLPVTTPEAFVERLWSAVTPKTKVISICHITSPTALIIPVQEICRRAREAGIMTIVDGAHVLGHIPLDLKALDADFYMGTCHKWLCAPKGAGFLFAKHEHQAMLDPLMIGSEWNGNSSFVEQNNWHGTRDIAAYLSVPSAIEFQREYDWDTVRQKSHVLAKEARARLSKWSGIEPISPDSTDWFAQMATIPLPACDTTVVKQRLYDEFRVEIPVILWDEKPYVRVSFQGYNTADDLEQLLYALKVNFS